MLNPLLFTFAAAAVSVPILIHLLLRQRRKPVRWAAMRFLMEAYRKHRRVLTVQQWLLLACRCLVLLFLALALGRVLVAAAGFGDAGARTVVLVVDTSIASRVTTNANASVTADASAFRRHIDEAKRIAGSLDARDRLAIIDLSAPASLVLAPTLVDPGAAGALLDELQPTDAGADVPGALRLAASTIAADADRDPPTNAADAADSERLDIVLLSELRAGSAPVDDALPAVLGPLAAEGRVRIIANAPATRPADNLQLLAVEPLERLLLGGTNAERPQVTVRVRRSGVLDAQPTRVSLAVTHGGRGARSLRDAADANAAAAVGGIIDWRTGQRDATLTLQAPAATDPSADARSRDANDAAGVRAAAAADESALVIAWTDRDALAADSVRAATVVSRDGLRVGLVGPRRFGRGPGVAAFDAADWLRAALEPAAGNDLAAAPAAGAVSVTPLSPAAIDPVGLAGLDAIVLPTPQLVSAGGWSALAAFVRRGGALLLMPPAGEDVQLWADPFARAMGLPRNIAREPRAFPNDGASLDVEPARESRLLRLIAGELGELGRPVRVQRALALADDPAGASVALRLTTGEPWLIVGRPRAVGAADANPTANAADQTAADDDGASRATRNATRPVPGAARPLAEEAGAGVVVLLGSAIDPAWTNLPLMPLMVPLVQETVRRSVGLSASETTLIAGAHALAPAGAVRFEGPGADRSVRPGERVALRLAGRHTFSDAAERAVQRVVVNPDVAAATLEPRSPDRVATWLSGAAPNADGFSVEFRNSTADDQRAEAPLSAAAGDDGRAAATPFDLWFLALVAVFALVETVLAKLFSHASAAGAADPRRTASAAIGTPATEGAR